MNADASKAERIATVNDAFRYEVLTFGRAKAPGICVFTRGIACLDPTTIGQIVIRTRIFKTFTEDNDPHGEHDFGAFDQPNVGKIFWKIDYYADQQCRNGSEAPEDPKRSYRVLTIMLAEEY